MAKKQFFFYLFLFIIVIIGAFAWKNYNAKPTSSSSSHPAATSEKATSSSTEKVKKKKAATVEELVDEMTTEEKVGQLFLARTPEVNQIADIEQFHLGGYILFDRDMMDQTQTSIKQTIASYQSASAIPMFIASDEEGGVVSRLSYNDIVTPAFPSPQELYQKGAWEAVKQDVERKGLIFHELGIQLGMSPVADVATDPTAFIYNRTIGLDAAGTSEYVQTVVKAQNGVHIGSTLKHFPGYGNNADSHVDIVTDTRTKAELEATDFLPFIAGIQAGADSIMVSHNIVNAIDATQPASISKAVHDVIRNELHFNGVIMTDDMDMAGLAKFTSQDEAGLAALQAGNDLILSSSYATQIPYILQAIKDGKYSETALNQSVTRVLQWKQELGMLAAVKE